MDPMDSISDLSHIKVRANGFYNCVCKRFLDICISLVALCILCIPLLLLALIIRLDSKGPALFSQFRIGYRCKPFRLYKLRTMVVCAGGHDPAHIDGNTDRPFVQRKEDERVTRVGKVLRRLSIDELPQLINVLKGDMSLIGPRPFIPAEAEALGEGSYYRYKVRPGITGYAQVSGRSDIGSAERLEKDFAYVNHVSFWLDVKIFFQTIKIIFTGKGAY